MKRSLRGSQKDLPYRELPKEELDRLKQPGSPMPSDFRKKHMQNLPKKAEDDELDPAVPLA